MQDVIRNVAGPRAIPWVLIVLVMGSAAGACGGKGQERAATSGGGPCAYKPGRGTDGKLF